MPREDVQVASEAAGSAYFSVGAPAAYRTGGGLELAGRVCRLRRTTQLSPPRVRVEHLSPTGEVLASASARAPAIYRNFDQSCQTYGAKVDWRLADGDRLRACIDRGRACPTGAPAKPAVPDASGGATG